MSAKLLVLAFALAACSNALNARAYDEPCAGHECHVSLTNHSTDNLSVSYADSTGRRELIGLIPPAGTRVFDVQWVHSAGIRVFAKSKLYGLYAADLGFNRARRINDLHYPDDFDQVGDTLMPVLPIRKP